MPEIAKATITLLFADIEGSTRLIDEIGHDFAGVLGDYREMLERAIALGGGHTVNTEGDGHFAAFPTPSGGVIAAVEAQRLFSAHQWPGGKDVRTRMGVHVGEVWQTLDDFAGPEVHRAARIASAAHGGQVLISQAVLQGLDPGLPDEVEARDLGSHMLKDLARPERLYQLDVSGLRTDFPPIRTLESGAHNLTAQLTSFVGREEEMKVLQSMLEGNRLVVLSGPGGVGKTRLATQVAAADLGRHPDGVWLVELAPTSEASLVAAEVARTFRVQQEAGSPAIETILRYLTDKQLLLVLDNCEHVIDAAASFAEQALHRCPNVQILATSREALGVTGEAHYPLAPLGRPSGTSPEQLADSGSVRLFVERAELAQPEFELDEDNSAAVAEICARLDGIPLALELAAARVRVLSVHQIADRLDDQLRLLAGRERGRPERHRTLTAAMEWSHNLLADHERMLLRRLSVFSGDFTVDHVEAVCPDEGCPREEILDLLARLIDTSLVVPGSGTEPRHRLLETVRQYAGERLAEAGEAETMRRKHAELFRDLVDGGGTGLQPLELTRWLTQLEPDVDNFNAALQWSLDSEHHDIALGLAGGLARLFYRHGYYAEMRRWFDAVLQYDGYPPNADLARVLRFASGLAMDGGDLERADRLAAREIEIARAVDDPGVLARSLNLRAGLAWRRSRFSEAAEAYDEALQIARSAESTFLPHLLINYSELSVEVGLLDRAGVALSELEELLSSTDQDLPDLNRARGHLAYARGDLDTALREYDTAVSEYRRHGLRAALAKALQGLGLALAYSGKTSEAREAVAESIGLYREMSDYANEGESLCALATVALAESNPTEARRHLKTALSCYETAHRADGVADVAVLAIPIALTDGRVADAAVLLGATDAAHGRLGMRHPEPQVASTELHRSQIVAALDRDDYVAAIRRGESLDGDGLLTFTRSVL